MDTKKGHEPTEKYIEIDLLRLMERMWHWAWAIVLAMAAGGALLFSYAYFIVTPMYRATALLYVNNSSISVGSTSISLSDLSASQTLVDTYLVILKSRLTLNEVIERAGLEYTYEELCEMIEAQAVDATEIFEVSVLSSDPAEAERITNTIVDVLPEKIADIVDGSSVRTVDYAVIPLEKDSPSITMYTAIGLAMGLVLSCLVLLVAEACDEQIHDADYLLQSYDLPVLAVIPDLLSKKTDKYGANYYAAREGES